MPMQRAVMDRHKGAPECRAPVIILPPTALCEPSCDLGVPPGLRMPSFFGTSKASVLASAGRLIAEVGDCCAPGACIAEVLCLFKQQLAERSSCDEKSHGQQATMQAR
jgi:hypothetical protein